MTTGTEAVVGRSVEPCWCGGDEWRLTFRTRRSGLVQCVACGCYRTDPSPLRDNEQARAFYTEYYARMEGACVCPTPSPEGRGSRFWRVAEQVPGLCETGRLAADIGCGEGHLCAQLRSAGWSEVLGFDVSKFRIGKARTLYPGIRFFDTSITEAGLAPGSVDLMIMDNVIEHLPAPLHTLSDLRDFLAPDGRLALITPNMRSGNFRLLGRRWTPELAPHAHIFLFTPTALQRLLARAGYRVFNCGAFATPLSPWRQERGGLGLAGLKEIAWRAAQNLGTLYGGLIGAGAMLYAVARRDQACSSSSGIAGKPQRVADGELNPQPPEAQSGAL